ncbi:MAG: cation diffusion facilitator family transporter [Bacteroidales bacterium]|nr:cation diffusion facilitator family transporter [Bacteroidales bacterium]
MAVGKREKKIIRASWVAIAGNALLSVLKITVGLLFGSFAVVADGIDSATDIITSIVTLFTAHIVARPPDTRYPYGYSKADTIATKLLAFIIFFAGAQLALSTIGEIIHPFKQEIPGTLAIWVVLVSILGKVLLAFYLKKTGRAVDSSMLIANARNMQNDVVISVSVLLGLAFTFWLQMPVLDAITAFLVSIYIMFIAFRIFMQSNRELMDGVEDKQIYKTIIQTVKQVKGASNPHRIRVRKMSHLYVIALDIEADGMLSLHDAHQIGADVERELKHQIKNVYDVLVHVEPVGNVEPDEVFGVSEDKL